MGLGAGGVQIAALALPIVGLFVMFGRLGKRVLAAGWRGTAGKPIFRTGFVTTTTAVAGLLVFLWLPNGEYEPIQPGERGTVQELAASFEEIGTGRPGLTEERAEELGPIVRLSDPQSEQSTGPVDDDEGAGQPTPPEPTGESTPLESSEPTASEEASPTSSEEASPTVSPTASSG